MPSEQKVTTEPLYREKRKLFQEEDSEAIRQNAVKYWPTNSDESRPIAVFYSPGETLGNDTPINFRGNYIIYISTGATEPAPGNLSTYYIESADKKTRTLVCNGREYADIQADKFEVFHNTYLITCSRAKNKMNDLKIVDATQLFDATQRIIESFNDHGQRPKRARK